ncbi:AraC family transcriptional regulator [Membranihabitans maritimus]|uniref:AraC family transcriptional regulator n=1 Tax=Membranihabitans maritimus TaxID=2904244 RepID=UPI001F39FFC9|nr:helix-turn-helix domain-containing protein [Membranihabitans maritimus]
MNKLNSIKDLFKPVQPAIKAGQNQVSYMETPPDFRLSDFIYCYWQLATQKPLDKNFIYRVVTDGCIDILWEANSPHQNFITGFSNQYMEFQLETTFNYMGIRFLPTAFPLLFNLPASELTNRFEDLYAVNSLLSMQISQSIEGSNILESVKTKLDNLFLLIIRDHQTISDPRLFHSLEIILQNKGQVGIEKDLETGLSTRQLRRLFKFYIGDSPKTFSKVVRFQSFLNQNPTRKNIRGNKIYFDLGYFDQSHFIKDFKNFYGLPPSRAFD